MNGIDQIKRKVKNHGCPPVMALIGDERALVEEALVLVRDAYLVDTSADFNHQKFSAMDNDAPDLLAPLLTMPFLATHRVVEVHYAEKLHASVVTLLMDYIEKPCASSLLVLVFYKADKRNKLLSLLEKRGDSFTLSVDGKADRRNYLLAEALTHEITIAPNAVELMLALTDGDLLLIKTSVEKLALVSKEITTEHVEQHLVASGDEDVFALARAIGEGHLPRALVALGRLRNNNENAIKFLGVLLWQLRVLVNIRSCCDQGMADFDIRKAVNVYGDRFTWMSHVAKKRTLEFHIDRLTKLIDCDRALKTGAVHEPFHVLERYVYQSAVGLQSGSQ